MTRRLIALALQGATHDEIGKHVGMSGRAVYGRLARLGIEGGGPGRRRLPAAFVSVETRAAIEKVAAERGADVGNVLRDVLTFAFEDDSFHARRLLRTPAKRANSGA